ncbi:lysoplasmalogenase [Leptospira langatensis]|uniref:Lysoplasmalogenase n=1 Tax=Leptospira langatensis TaxID=2484983 RepID=A0A5F1ZRX2_9LEPT|nr:lysoplasmalogenase [Leptospira langatensis]TGK01883.1 lysoplasmalogenase [Leptospira langatensis]TGL39488.1 lysoplasmalogenase [Leptospira langatensis]
MIYIAFPILALFHLVVVAYWPDVFLLRLFSKIAPIVLLIVSSVWEEKWKTRAGIWLVIGLVFSLIGDTFLALPDNYFVLGLGSFLIAQVSYAICFSIGNPVHLIRLFPFLIFGAGYYSWLLPGIGAALQIPVAVYVTAICIMGWRSTAREVSPRDRILGILGALSFILSDSLIALGQFTSVRLPLHGVWIMGTYYLAQVLIYLSQEEE